MKIVEILRTGNAWADQMSEHFPKFFGKFSFEVSNDFIPIEILI